MATANQNEAASDTAAERFREVELPLLGEFLLGFVVVFVIAGAAVGTREALFPAAGVLALGVAAFSSWRRWRKRLALRHKLLHWQSHPITWNGTVVVQADQNAGTVARIDPTRHYTVRWECFSSGRAVYLVRQGDENMIISTLAPNARQVIVEILRVSNYPCVSWPNYDM